MTVRFSCCCPNADYLGFEATPEGIIAWAAKAEELGFDAFFVNDHIIVDSSTRSGPWTNTYAVGRAVVYRCKHDPDLTRHIGADRAVPQPDLHRQDAGDDRSDVRRTADCEGRRGLERG